MDQRQVFNAEDDLLSFVKDLSNNRARASLLVDKDGLTRMEGEISAVNPGQQIKDASIVVDGTEILLRNIIGINGIFRAEYCEC